MFLLVSFFQFVSQYIISYIIFALLLGFGLHIFQFMLSKEFFNSFDAFWLSQHFYFVGLVFIIGNFENYFGNYRAAIHRDFPQTVESRFH